MIPQLPNPQYKYRIYFIWHGPIIKHSSYKDYWGNYWGVRILWIVILRVPKILAPLEIKKCPKSKSILQSMEVLASHIMKGMWRFTIMVIPGI